MPYELFCAIIGHKGLITLNVDGTWTVGKLQEHIKEKKPHLLASYEADTLVLYKVDIDVSNKEISPGVIEQIRQGSIKGHGEELISALSLSDYWGEGLPKPKAINILVELPPGESSDSIDPRVCCITETDPISSATDEKSELMSLMFSLLSPGVVLMAGGVNFGKH